MKRIILTSVFIFMSLGSLWAQGRTMSFTSVTDAKFFVYLNGKLQNERSTGMITLNNLEDKEYHVRIVIDDPFEVATTKRIRPDEKGCEYTVRFNAVREKVELKKSDSRSRRNEESSWASETTTKQDNEASTQQNNNSSTRKRYSIRHNTYEDTATVKVLNNLHLK